MGTTALTAADLIIEEMKTLQQLEHPNLIWLHEIINDTDGHTYLVTHYYPNGSLGDELRRINVDDGVRVKGLPVWQTRFFFIDMLKALHYCHKIIGVVHRDIKPDNIMIGRKREAVLIDFGVSTKYDLDADKENEKANQILKLKTGTYMFFAPELFLTGKDRATYGPATDIWALGMTFYYLLTGKLPYEDAKNLFHLIELI